ncbi:MAG: transglutaminase family protein [Thermodesulfobacteriota bacterium]|nr:transglutaminase family protein [Thermodesulfobacteriota bacterium]
MKKYLEGTYFIDIEHPAIKTMASRIIQKGMSEQDIATGLFYAVRDSIRYTPLVEAYKRETNRVSRVIEQKQGYCVQKACVLVGLARYAGIPARLGLADIQNHLLDGNLLEWMGTNIFTCHGYAEMFIEKKWVKATPAFNLELCEKTGVAPVRFDGVNDAILPDTDLRGRPYIEYLSYHGTFSDLPHTFIMKKWKEHYPLFKEILEQEIQGQ